MLELTDFNQGNDEIEQNFFNCMNSLCAGQPSLSENTVMSTGEMSLVVSDKELNKNICLLNKKQRVFDTVYSWSISYMKKPYVTKHNNYSAIVFIYNWWFRCISP